jgi:hypothetical protein
MMVYCLLPAHMYCLSQVSQLMGQLASKDAEISSMADKLEAAVAAAAAAAARAATMLPPAAAAASPGGLALVPKGTTAADEQVRMALAAAQAQVRLGSYRGSRGNSSNYLWRCCCMHYCDAA